MNRPGLQLAGFYEYFDNNRIQIIGNSETAYLNQCGTEIRLQRLKKFFSMKPAAVIVSRGLEVADQMKEYAEKHFPNAKLTTNSL